jgi:hypothetical protein
VDPNIIARYVESIGLSDSGVASCEKVVNLAIVAAVDDKIVGPRIDSDESMQSMFGLVRTYFTSGYDQDRNIALRRQHFVLLIA